MELSGSGNVSRDGGDSNPVFTMGFYMASMSIPIFFGGMNIHNYKIASCWIFIPIFWGWISIKYLWHYGTDGFGGWPSITERGAATTKQTATGSVWWNERKMPKLLKLKTSKKKGCLESPKKCGKRWESGPPSPIIYIYIHHLYTMWSEKTMVLLKQNLSKIARNTKFLSCPL